MDIPFVVRGLVIGLSVAAPVGPMSLLVMQTTLAQGWLPGLVAGLGVAAADALYGAVAAFGLTAVAGLLVAQQPWLRLGGGLFLAWLGGRILLTPPATRAASAGAAGLAGTFGTMLLLTLANPTTILSFAAIFAGVGVGETGGDLAAAVALVLGVFAGSALWWLALTAAVGRARTVATPGALRWVNRVAGAVLIAAGLLALLSLRG